MSPSNILCPKGDISDIIMQHNLWQGHPAESNEKTGAHTWFYAYSVVGCRWRSVQSIILRSFITLPL